MNAEADKPRIDPTWLYGDCDYCQNFDSHLCEICKYNPEYASHWEYKEKEDEDQGHSPATYRGIAPQYRKKEAEEHIRVVLEEKEDEENAI